MPYTIISLVTLKLKASNVHWQPASRCFVSDWAELRGDAVGEHSSRTASVRTQAEQPGSKTGHTAHADKILI